MAEWPLEARLKEAFRRAALKPALADQLRVFLDPRAMWVLAGFMSALALIMWAAPVTVPMITGFLLVSGIAATSHELSAVIEAALRFLGAAINAKSHEDIDGAVAHLERLAQTGALALLGVVLVAVLKVGHRAGSGLTPKMRSDLHAVERQVDDRLGTNTGRLSVRRPTRWDKLPNKVEGKEVDRIITSRYRRYLSDDLKGGHLMEKNSRVLPHDDFQAELRNYRSTMEKARNRDMFSTKQPDLDVQMAHTQGFEVRNADGTRTVFLDGDVAAADNLFHEGLHGYAHPNWRNSVHQNLDETVTEYLSNKHMVPRGITPSSHYAPKVETFKPYAARVGDEVIERAYFGGDVQALRDAVSKTRGSGWGTMCFELGAMGS